MSIENQNRDPLTVNHSDGSEPRREIPVSDINIPDCWHVAMATEKGLGQETILTCWHLAADLHDKLMKLAEPEPTVDLPRCTGGDTEQSLEVVWAVLQNWHECKPVTEETQTQWDDICTAMAWIREGLGLPSEVEVEACSEMLVGEWRGLESDGNVYRLVKVSLYGEMPWRFSLECSADGKMSANGWQVDEENAYEVCDSAFSDFDELATFAKAVAAILQCEPATIVRAI